MRFHRWAFAAALLAVGTFTSHNGLVWADETVEAAPTTPEAVPEYAPPENAEDFKFEAEVHRMLDIVVNSLYQNKDVFLRELISNASDALDKIRFLALTQPDLVKDKEELEVRIEFDADAKTLTIRDSGIGMTHDDLVKNLGTVARSGTTKFLEALSEKEQTTDMGGLIGQFGVGFYSTFLVSDRVSVASKHPDSDKQFVWESVNGQDSFHVFEDPRGNTLDRGTEITLHLKNDCMDYADEDRLKDLVTHYSEFITHPIYLLTTSTMTVDVEDDDEEEEATEKSEDDIEVGEDEEEVKEKKTKEVTTQSWDQMNVNQAIWTRDKDSITDEEYQSFWQVVSKEPTSEAEKWIHFNAEGSVNFRSILYLPKSIPDQYKFGNVDKVEGGLKLYVRRVLISDDFDLLPRYLGFMRGVIDSDDLPLNVNRETLQESKILKIIKKKLVRKALDMIRNFAKEDPSESEEEEVELDEEGNIIDEEVEEKEHPYLAWYKKFSNNIKMGVIDDEPNRSKLAKLLRYQTSKSGDKFISLEEYVDNMKDWQKDIYVLGGMNLEEVKSSPFLEEFANKDAEVIFLTDAVDEYMVQNLRDFDGKKFSAITSESVKLGDEDDEDLAKRREKAYKAKFKPLTKWLKKLYGSSIMRIQVSKRLGKTPALVSNSEYGHSANMERIMRAQAYSWGQDDFMARAMKVLEINPRHPFVLKLLDECPSEDDDAKASSEVEDAAWMLLDVASLSGGFPVSDTKAHAERMSRFLQSSLGVDSVALEDEIDPPEDDDEDDEDAPDFDMHGMDGMNMEDFNMDNIDLD